MVKGHVGLRGLGVLMMDGWVDRLVDICDSRVALITKKQAKRLKKKFSQVNTNVSLVEHVLQKFYHYLK